MSEEIDDTDEPEVADEKTSPKRIMGLALSDAEIFSIGRIVAYWGLLEHEIFEQAALSFAEGDPLPSELHSNRDFPAVQAVWRERVVSQATGQRRSNLERQDSRITHLHQYRPAIVHAMWQWEKADPSVIISQRIVKRSIQTVRFTGEDLAEMATAIGEILYWVTYPGGEVDRIAELVEAGGYMSRSFYAMLTGHPEAERLLPFSMREALRAAAALEPETEPEGDPRSANGLGPKT